MTACLRAAARRCMPGQPKSWAKAHRLNSRRPRITSPRRASTILRSNGGARPATKLCAARRSRKRSPSRQGDRVADKADAGSRRAAGYEAESRRLTQLQVAYGNALFTARGFGAPETTEAFARTRESASGDEDAPGRLEADYGLWVGSYGETNCHRCGCTQRPSSATSKGNAIPLRRALRASAYGVEGKADAAYFRMINEMGGVNGRKINLISLDDGYSPPRTVEQTRRLVEQDGVAFIFDSLGTPTNAAIRQYLNDNKVPQLFIASGAAMFSDPQHFPWTMGFIPNFRAEARISPGASWRPSRRRRSVFSIRTTVSGKASVSA